MVNRSVQLDETAMIHDIEDSSDEELDTIHTNVINSITSSSIPQPIPQANKVRKMSEFFHKEIRRVFVVLQSVGSLICSGMGRPLRALANRLTAQPSS